MHSSTSNFERVIPTQPWRGIAVSVGDDVAVLVAIAAWEVYCRSLGYGPTLNDTGDLWAEARRRVQPESHRHRRRFARAVSTRSRRTRARAWASVRCNSRCPAAGVSRAGQDLANDRAFTAPSSAALSRECSSRRRVRRRWRSFGKSGAADPTPRRMPNAPVTNSRNLSRRMFRLPEAGRPHARRAS